MTLADDVVTLQNRLAEAHRAKARAEGARDQAQAAAEHARAELLNGFGVQSTEAAEHLLIELRGELEALTEQISTKLDEIGV
jgi:hypothetical protein